MSVGPRSEKFNIVSNDHGSTQKCDFCVSVCKTNLSDHYAHDTIHGFRDSVLVCKMHNYFCTIRNQFWNQFETEIDKVEIHAINKFSYLKEFIVTNVKALIDDLPFTSEVYMRPKSILLAKFGKPSGVAAAHIQWITSLPVVSNSNPNKILEFYEKLVVSVQAFDKN